MKRIRAMCSIQEGSLGYEKIKQLESVMESTYQSHFGSEHKLTFFWIKVPFEQAYLAGELSTASSVQIPVEDGLNNDKRHQFMSEICAKWQHISGCNNNEIILVCPDHAAFDAFQDAMSARFKGSGKLAKLKILLKLLLGRFRDGYLNTSVNI